MDNVAKSPFMNGSKTIAILADLPVWTIPGYAHLRSPGHYATWLEPLIPEFESHKDLNIHWVTFSKNVSERQLIRVYGQTIHVLPRKSKMFAMLLGYLPEIVAVRRILHEINAELVHAWGTEDAYGLAGAFSGVSRRFFTLQGCLTEYLRLLGGNWLFRLQAMYEKFTIRRYYLGTTESPGARDLMQAIHPTIAIDLVDYGVHPDFFEISWNPCETPEVIFVGGINKRKGIEDLVQVAAMPELSHIKFKILGEGYLSATLMATSSPNIAWMGKCDRKTVIQELAKAWCLFMPTYSDTGPTVVKEARVIGLPVITTTGAGASSYIEHEKSGFVINPGDQESMAQALSKICLTKAKCLEMGQHEWKYTRNSLHPSVTAEKFAMMYRRMFSVETNQ